MAKKSKNIYFGCRLPSAVVEQVRESAHVSGRTIGHELARILEWALPSFREMDTAIERERRESFKKKAKAGM
jgi:Arc-like DNA binding domain